jgi:hypothetical protein
MGVVRGSIPRESIFLFSQQKFPYFKRKMMVMSREVKRVRGEKKRKRKKKKLFFIFANM